MKTLLTILFFLPLLVNAQQRIIVNGHKHVSGPSYDSDAQAFFTAASITDDTQKDAVNQLVLDLKAASLWSSLIGIYPIVGGTAATHKFNLKDPRDLDAAFRLVFNGTWTHSSNGADPNGSNGYANTFINPSTAGLSATAGGMMYWSNEASVAASNSTELGCVAANNDQMSISIRYTGNLFGAINTAGGANLSTSSNSTTNGGFYVNRANTNTEGYINSSRVINATYTGAAPNANIYAAAINNKGTAAEFSSKRCAFIAVWTAAYSTVQQAALHTAIANYQTALSR